MKKIIVTALVAISVSLVSCNDNAMNPASEAIEAVDFANGGGGTNGERPQLTEVTIGDLSSTITDYINTNYAGSSIDKAGTDAEGNFIVGITQADESHKGLLFDAAGTFQNELEGRKGGKKGGKGDRPQLTEVTVADLSSTITDYINTNYADATIDKAGTDAEGNFIIGLSLSDETQKRLLFEATGIFQKELEGRKGGDKGNRPQLAEVAIEDLSNTISDYISTNYAGANIDKAGTDDDSNFVVKLTLADETHKGLLFDAAGTFQKELTRNGPTTE
ncbi:MAG: hypothetical protein ACI9IP_002957 [Arcticibacterium sp.]|jgi:hypothetical protein